MLKSNMRRKIGMVGRTREVINTKRKGSGLIGNQTMTKVLIIGDLIGTMGNLIGTMGNLIGTMGKLIINHGRIRMTIKEVILGDRMTQNNKSRMNGDRIHQISGE